jgi:S-adenosylmethionine hydrolase
MPRPVIALLTDFGTRDHYAGTMKGVALGICPDVTLVDISHDLPPHDVVAAALELAAAYRYFPAGTIFLVVVDPGVGSARRGIAAEAGDYKFVAPDNGVLTVVLDEHPPKRIVELTERKYARPTVSRTFEGRDRFAPAAAWLARGVDVMTLGRSAGAILRLDLPRVHVDDAGIAGEVVRVDRFGNLITNIDRRTFEKLAGEALEIRIGPHTVSKVVSTYADAASGDVCALVALFGSTDHLEIAVFGASAAARLAVGRGEPVHVVRRA